MANEIADISEMDHPWFLHVWSHRGHDPSLNYVMEGLGRSHRGLGYYIELVLLSFPLGLDMDQNCRPTVSLFRTLVGESSFDSKIRLRLLGKAYN